MHALPSHHYLNLIARELDLNRASLYRTGSPRLPTEVGWIMTTDSLVNWGDETTIEFAGAILQERTQDPYLVLLGCTLAQPSHSLQFVFPVNLHGTQTLSLNMLGDLATQPTLTSTLLTHTNLFKEWTTKNTFQNASRAALRYTRDHQQTWTEEEGSHAIATFLARHPDPTEQWNLITHHAALCPPHH